MSDGPIDGELEDDNPASSWVEWFSQQNMIGAALRLALAKAIVLAMEHELLHIEYVDEHFIVKLPRAWIEQQLGRRLPL